MIAYNINWLKNILVTGEAEQAYKEGCISKPELTQVAASHQAGFYTPNFFIRIGIYVLTVIILLFSFGLITLLFMDALSKSLAGMSVFFGLVTFGALEFMVQNKHHYRSGADDALLLIAAGLVFGGVSAIMNAGNLSNCLLGLIFTCGAALRFTDRLMTLAAFLCLLGCCFFFCSNAGNTSKAIAPFVLMSASAIVYFLSSAGEKIRSFELYNSCLRILRISGLLSVYLAGNYFVVRELSMELFHWNLAPQDSIPYGWLFWTFTISIPFIYLIAGIRKKDSVLIRAGLLLIALMVCTVKYYNTSLSADAVMSVSGIVLLIVSYGLTQYLKIARHGFANKTPDEVEDEARNVESLVLAQTFAPQAAGEELKQFGGGSFGGGGSSADF